MVISLQSILNGTDLNKIPENVRNQIDCVLESKIKSLDLEKQRVQIIEKDYNDLKIKYDYNSDLLNRYKSHLAQLETDVHNARKELCDSNHQRDCLNVELKNQALEVQSKEEQIKRLNDLLKTKNEDTIELIEKNSKLQIELEETRKQNNSSIEVEEERFIKILAEKDKLCDLQCNYLKEELNRVTEEFHEKSSKLNSLNSEFINYKNETEIKLNDLNKENSSFKGQVNFLKNQIDKKDEQINGLAVKLKEINQHQDLLKEQYDIEKEQHIDLINYYKKVNHENQVAQNEILGQIKALEENHELREKQFEQANSKLVNENHQLLEEIRCKEEVILGLKVKIEELKSQILNLSQKEVDKAVNQFYPTSNTVAKLFENNMPLSMVYNKYEELQVKCQNLADENHELKLRIQEMITESESNAPLIYYKTQEVKKANAEIEEYKMQLSKISSDLGNSFSEIDNYNKMNNYLKRELKRYEKSNIDLTRQVQCLLQTVHELRGNFISTQFLVNDEHLAKENDYNKSISLNLVTFRNIEEMHENNKKLLSDLRALNDQLEELKEQNQLKDDESFKKHLDELLLEIESLKEENRHKQEILGEMMAERESKLNTSKLDTNSKDKQSSTSSLFKITSRAYLEDKVADLANKLDTKVEEFNSFKQQAKDQESKLKDEINKCQQQITNYQNEISKLTVKLDSVNENNKVLDSTLSRNHKETIMIKERNAKLEEQRKTLKERICTFESKKNELVSKLEEMKKDLDTKTNLINILEKQNTQIKCENGMIKSNLSEIKNELQETRKELLQLKTDSKVNTIRSECDLKNKIQILELTNSNLQTANQNLSAEKIELNAKFLEKEKQFKNSISQIKSRMLQLTEENNKLENERSNISKQLKEYQSKLNELEQSTDDNANSKAKILKLQMDAKNQIEEKNRRIAALTIEKEKLIEELKLKDQEIFKRDQELLKKEKYNAEMQSQVSSRMNQIQKIADESGLKEKLLKGRLEQLNIELGKKNEELNALKEEYYKLQVHNQFKSKQQMQIKTDTDQQQQQTSNQSNLTSAKSVIAKINPLSVNRSQIQSTTGNTSSLTIPQATITPTTQNTQSPTAYVTPTSLTNLEVSSAENISSNISSSTTSSLTSSSFSMPSTSSNLLTSSNQDQKRHSFSTATTTATGMTLKRQRISLADYQQQHFNKKQKYDSSNLFPSTSSTSSQTKQSETSSLFGNKNQIEQATCSSSSINDQEMLSTRQESTSTQDPEIPKTSTNTMATSKQENQEEKEAEIEKTENKSQQIVEQMESEIVNQEADGNSLGLEASNTESQDKPQQTRDSPTSNQVNAEEMDADNDDNLEEGEEEDEDEDDEEEENNNELDEEDYSANEDEAQLTDDDDDYDENSEPEEQEDNMDREKHPETNQEESQETNQEMNQDSTQNQDDKISEVICLSDEEDENSNDQQPNLQESYSQFGQFNQQFGQQHFEQPQEMVMDRKDEEFNADLDQQEQEQMSNNEADNAASNLNLYLTNESSQNQNYPDSANINQSEESTSNQESPNRPLLGMPALADLNRVSPFSEEKDENIGQNLVIDEQIESETDLTEAADSNLNTLASVTEQQQQLNMPSLSMLTNLESVQEEENSNQQSQQIDQVDQTRTTSTILQSTSSNTANQQKKSRLKRPTLKVNLNEQKKNNQDKATE